jgi:hypothetical protein
MTHTFRIDEGIDATMRPNQQNKNRQRGRNNNGGRKHINPLSRNYESNGPDVKVRGNASHIFEKYLQLARDAQSSGDSVMAENYLQHAEHYFRIVQAAQPQNQPRPDQPGAQEDEDDDFPPINDRFSSPEPRIQPYQQQDGQPAQQQPATAGEGDPAEPREPAMAQAEGDGQGGYDSEGEPRRHRDRPRRRRNRGNGEGAAPAGDPANAPQPDVGELPAFLTAGSSTAAE